MTDFDSLSHAQQLPILLELAYRAMAHYNLPDASTASLLNISENATYRIEAPDGRRWALRIHREGYQSRPTIASELAWAMNLRQTGVAITPNPIPGADGKLVQDVAHPRMKRPRHIVLFDWEDGTEPGIEDDLAGSFESLGEIAARMHVHARQWQRPKWFSRFTWDFETSLGEAKPHWGRWRDGAGLDSAGERLVQRTVDLIGSRLANYGMGADRFGLIHSDLRLANLLIDGKAVKVIDFDDCGFGWYMYDAATPVSFHEHQPHVTQLIESWKTGYRRVLPLSKADEAEIPTFVMLRRLLLVAWIGSHAETDLAKSMGLPYTEGTMGLCEDYLRKFG